MFDSVARPPYRTTPEVVTSATDALMIVPIAGLMAPVAVIAVVPPLHLSAISAIIALLAVAMILALRIGPRLSVTLMRAVGLISLSVVGLGGRGSADEEGQRQSAHWDDFHGEILTRRKSAPAAWNRTGPRRLRLE